MNTLHVEPLPIDVTTAVLSENSGQTYELTASLLGLENESSESFTAATPERTAQPFGTKSIDATWLANREAWRAGFDEGAKRGAAAYFNSPLMEDLALELVMLRAAVTAMTEQAERDRRTIDWYRTKLAEFARHVMRP